MGYKKYTIELIPDAAEKVKTFQAKPVLNSEEIGRHLGFSFTLGYYESTQNPSNPSGAYVFTPETGIPFFPAVTSSVLTETASFTIVNNEYQNGWRVSAKKYRKEPHVEVDWNVGKLNVEPGSAGTEAFITYKSAEMLDNNGTFFTDSNGWRNVERHLQGDQTLLRKKNS